MSKEENTQETNTKEIQQKFVKEVEASKIESQYSLIKKDWKNAVAKFLNKGIKKAVSGLNDKLTKDDYIRFDLLMQKIILLSKFYDSKLDKNLNLEESQKNIFKSIFLFEEYIDSCIHSTAPLNLATKLIDLDTIINNHINAIYQSNIHYINNKIASLGENIENTDQESMREIINELTKLVKTIELKLQEIHSSSQHKITPVKLMKLNLDLPSEIKEKKSNTATMTTFDTLITKSKIELEDIKKQLSNQLEKLEKLNQTKVAQNELQKTQNPFYLNQNINQIKVKLTILGILKKIKNVLIGLVLDPGFLSPFNKPKNKEFSTAISKKTTKFPPKSAKTSAITKELS